MAPVTRTLDEVTPSHNAQGFRPGPRATCESFKKTVAAMIPLNKPGHKDPVRRRTQPPTIPFSHTKLSKNRRRFAVPADRCSLTAARDSPAKPGLSLDFEGHPAGRALRPAAGGDVYNQAALACQHPGTLFCSPASQCPKASSPAQGRI